MPISDYVRGLRTQIGGSLLHMPSFSTALFDTEDRLLMAQQAGSSLWMTVGGAIEPDESPSNAAVREVLEETGIAIEPAPFRSWLSRRRRTGGRVSAQGQNMQKHGGLEPTR